jgi:hypothetical protein
VGVSSPASSVLASGLEGSSSSHALVGGRQVLLTTSGRLALTLFSAAEHSSLLDSLTTAAAMHDASSQSPWSLPFSGAPPAPASGGASGGSAASSGGTGPQLGGALALLLIALLGGKFLWYARNFLKPDSPFQLIVNQPG